MNPIEGVEDLMKDLVGLLEPEAARARGCLVLAFSACSFQGSDEAIQQLSIYLLWTLDLPVAESLLSLN